MRKIQQGFTLIELMIVVAIIGILAAVALPAYQDYTVRAKVSEVMLAASSGKTSIAEYFQTNNTLPADNTVAGLTWAQTKYVSAVSWDGTAEAIVATTNGTTEIPGGGGITLTANDAGNGQISWACSADIAPKYMPSSCR
jgi:type IV pilus assembly protein PilA